MKKVIFLLLFSFGVSNSFAQWHSNPSLQEAIVHTSTEAQYPISTTDGHNGSIVAFWSGTSNIGVKKVNSNGVLQWGDSTNYKVVSTTYNRSTGISIAPDQHGGAYIAWTDYRFTSYSPEVFIQHIDSLGNALWVSNGLRVDTLNYAFNYYPKLCLNDSGTVSILWTMDDGAGYQCYIQRYTSSGQALYNAGGIRVSVEPGFRYDCAINTDGNDGVVISFKDTRNCPNGTNYQTLQETNFDIYVQRLDAAGNRIWSADALVCHAPKNQPLREYIRQVNVGNGYTVLAWSDLRNNTTAANVSETNADIYAQRLDANGVAQWSADGLSLSTLPGNQYMLSLIADSAGGALAAWQSNNPSGVASVSAQRLSAAGAGLWANGTSIATPGLNCGSPSFFSDHAGGYTCIYGAANTSGTIWTARGQKFSASGNPQWSPAGIIITDTWPEFNCVESDSAGIIVIFSSAYQYNSNHNSLYGAKLLSNGNLAGAASNYTTIANGNWNDPSIWSGGVVPDAGSAVIINNTVTVTANTTCYSLTVIPPGNVHVNTGVVLTVLH